MFNSFKNRNWQNKFNDRPYLEPHCSYRRCIMCIISTLLSSHIVSIGIPWYKHRHIVQLQVGHAHWGFLDALLQMPQIHLKQNTQAIHSVSLYVAKLHLHTELSGCFYLFVGINDLLSSINRYFNLLHPSFLRRFGVFAFIIYNCSSSSLVNNTASACLGGLGSALTEQDQIPSSKYTHLHFFFIEEKKQKFNGCIK